MVVQDCARAYRKNAVLTATPGQLVLMLYDAALQAMARARDAFSRPETDLKRYEAVNAEIRKARRIITELQGRLDFSANEELAGQLFRLYDYYNRRLQEANLKKQPAPVAEVERLLGDLRNAWADMLRQQPAKVETVLAS